MLLDAVGEGIEACRTKRKLLLHCEIFFSKWLPKGLHVPPAGLTGEKTSRLFLG